MKNLLVSAACLLSFVKFQLMGFPKIKRSMIEFQGLTSLRLLSWLQLAGIAWTEMHLPLQLCPLKVARKYIFF